MSLMAYGSRSLFLNMGSVEKVGIFLTPSLAIQAFGGIMHQSEMSSILIFIFLLALARGSASGWIFGLGIAPWLVNVLTFVGVLWTLRPGKFLCF